MCPRRTAARPEGRESIPDLMLRARLLEQEALRESDSVRRSALRREVEDLRSEARRRLKRCVASQCACASGE